MRRGYADTPEGQIHYTTAGDDQQSQELDQKRRLALVQEIQARFEEEAVRPIMGWRLDYFARWPHVRDLVPHNSNYSFGRMQNVWLDR